MPLHATLYHPEIPSIVEVHTINRTTMLRPFRMVFWICHVNNIKLTGRYSPRIKANHYALSAGFQFYGCSSQRYFDTFTFSLSLWHFHIFTYSLTLSLWHLHFYIFTYTFTLSIILKIMISGGFQCYGCSSQRYFARSHSETICSLQPYRRFEIYVVNL